MPQPPRLPLHPSFATATACLADLTIDYREADLDDLCRAEEVILRHSPSTFAEVAAILDVLMAQEAERSDGLDKQALKGISTFIRRRS